MQHDDKTVTGKSTIRQWTLRPRYETVLSSRTMCNYVLGRHMCVTASFSSMLIAKIITWRKTKRRKRDKLNAMCAISTLIEVFSFSPSSLTFEITNSVVIRVHKTARINLIENRVIPPSSVEDLPRDKSDRR